MMAFTDYEIDDHLSEIKAIESLARAYQDHATGRIVLPFNMDSTPNTRQALQLSQELKKEAFDLKMSHERLALFEARMDKLRVANIKDVIEARSCSFVRDSVTQVSFEKRRERDLENLKKSECDAATSTAYLQSL